MDVQFLGLLVFVNIPGPPGSPSRAVFTAWRGTRTYRVPSSLFCLFLSSPAR